MSSRHGYDGLRPMAMQEMVIYGVSFDQVGRLPFVLLKTAEGNRFLPIWIGAPEAQAILMKLQGTAAPRPLTHDLFTSILGQLEAKVERISVTDLKENTFYAVITLAREGGEEIEIDSRPSDAIALAVRADAPIFAADSVIDEASVVYKGNDLDQDAIVAQFKEFLDSVTPDEFAGGQDS